jgi:glycosyltransferase involved in cell wall biosynthesis
MAKKKLLITTDCFLPRWDGIARFLWGLLPHLKQDFEVTVIAPRFGKLRQKPQGVKLARFPLLPMQFGDIRFSQPRFGRVREYVRQADLVFNQTIGPIGIAAIRAARQERKPIVCYIHSIEWELASRAVRRGFRGVVATGVRQLARWLYNQSTLLLVPAKDTEDLLRANGIRTRMRLVRLGVDTETFIPPASRPAAKRALGLDPASRVVGFVGRIGREKDLPTLVEAFRRIRRKVPRAELLIVGKGIRDVRPEPHITLAGATDNVVPYLQAMDIFVLPSLTETSSLATMEAMSCGLPVIVTPVGKIREYVVDGVNGLIFPRQDAESLAEKLLLLLKHSPKLRRELGEHARTTITAGYRWEDTVKDIRSVLKDAAAEKRKA